jgi:hypothetical protein
MFEIEMLPAREGDCLWIRYGNARKPHQILIDGGRASTGKALKLRFAKLPKARRTFELLIISHIDRDHIEGILELLEDPNQTVKFRDIWFNGFDHLMNVPLETFGAVQGERLSAALLNLGLPWNRRWKKKAVCLGSKGLKRFKLDGGLTLTLLSPDRQKLNALRQPWIEECQKAGIIPNSKPQRPKVPGFEILGALDIESLAASKFVADKGEPNGSSIAILAEHKGRKALLAADAHTDRLVSSIKSLKKSAKRLKVDVLKVAHHASQHNISPELLQLLDCKKYLVSTNGSYFKHPKPEAMARILKFGGSNKTIFFNYRSKFTNRWNSKTWKTIYNYTVVYPDKKDNGRLVLAL